MIDIPNNLETILHIGAGQGEELPDYLASNAKHILLVEPNPRLAELLRQRTQGESRVQVLEIAVTDNSNLNQLYEYNLPEAASLYRPTGLRQLFPGLRVTGQHPVIAKTPEQLLTECPLFGEQNLLVLQAPGAELAIIKALAKTRQLEHISHIWLTCPKDAYYEAGSRSDAALAELQQQGYELKAENQTSPDWPQWQLACNPLARKVDALEVEKQALNAKLEDEKRHRGTLEQKNKELEAQIKKLQAALDQANNRAAQLEESHKSSQQEVSDLKEQLVTLKAKQQQTEEANKQHQQELKKANTQRSGAEKRAKELATQVKQLEDRLASEQSTLKAKQQQTEEANKQHQQELKKANTQRAETEKRAEQLATQVKQLENRLATEQSCQKQFGEIKQRMEYLFDQQSLQLEQAANALGRHVSTTAQSTAKELEAGLALQQQYGGDLPALEQGNARLPSTVALALSRQLKAQPYDLIIELGSGITTTFMAHTLRHHNGQHANGEKSRDTQVSRYIDPSEDDLPKRIICFEHNRSSYNQRLESLKGNGLSPVIGLQFAPLVPYSYQGQEYLFYDCANRLQQIAKLFDDRQARIFVLVNQAGGESQPEPFVALPQVLQHLSAHTLDIVVNTQGRAELIEQWQTLLDQRGLGNQTAEFGSKHVQRFTVNP